MRQLFVLLRLLSYLTVKKGFLFVLNLMFIIFFIAVIQYLFKSNLKD